MHLVLNHFIYIQLRLQVCALPVFFVFRHTELMVWKRNSEELFHLLSVW